MLSYPRINLRDKFFPRTKQHLWKINFANIRNISLKCVTYLYFNAAVHILVDTLFFGVSFYKAMTIYLADIRLISLKWVTYLNFMQLFIYLSIHRFSLLRVRFVRQ